jgi:VWFA-related protein
VTTIRVFLGVLLAAAGLVTFRVTGVAQAPSPSAQSTFRSTVDLLTIETSVRDKSGPVPDLTAADFTVTIDGKPRRVVSAVFFKAEAADGRRITVAATPTPQYVSNDQTAPGRVVVFALDSGTIRGGQERALLETASGMIERLSPADAVGLVEIPGTAIDVTRDHAAVIDALKRFRGRAPGEAEERTRRNNLPAPPGAAANALGQLNDRADAQRTLLDLATLIRGMAAVRAPRSVILISGGLASDQEVLAHYKVLQRAASESRTVLYTVLLEQVGPEVSRGETRPDAADNPAKTEGLATIAAMTGGMFFNVAGTATGVFDRIQSEVTSSYQLAIESSPADADGKEHDVKVKVTRAGVDVRAPTHVAVAKLPSGPTPRDPLLNALRQPTDVSDVPLAVTTYSTHAADGAVQLLVSAAVGGPNGPPPAEWGLVVTQKGKDVAIRRGRFPAGSERPRMVTTSLDVPPGDYRLRLAAVDVEDRAGVLEVSVTAAYLQAGGTMMSDLVVGAAAAGEFEPRRTIASSEELIAMLQVMASASAMPGGSLQLIPPGTARSALTLPLSVRPGASEGLPAILQARGSLATVPPGRYTASAVLSIDGQPLARVNRLIEIAGPLRPQTAAGAAPVTASAATGARAVPATPSATAPPAGSAEDIMRRVSAYVAQFGGQASLLVAVERYSQSLNVRGRSVDTQMRIGGRITQTESLGEATVAKRRLVSEFALMPNASASGGWLGYRDVMEVDGRAVADRGGRLQRLFRADTPDLAAARRIADEGARYNIGSVSRNFNVPTTTLFFFDAGNLPRFTFRRTGRDRIDGVDTVVIDFHEERAPTLIMNASGADVPSSGTLWVNPTDGTVLRTRLELKEYDSAGSRAVIDVVYRKDPGAEMWDPSRMTERYTTGPETTTTEATYHDFKRFQTSVKIK